MAQVNAKGTRVRIAADVWIDKKTQTVHVTSNDPDLPGAGLHLTARKGTQNDRNARFMCATLLPTRTASEIELEAAKMELVDMLSDAGVAEDQAIYSVEKLVHLVVGTMLPA